jgi:hypothetical protein
MEISHDELPKHPFIPPLNPEHTVSHSIEHNWEQLNAKLVYHQQEISMDIAGEPPCDDAAKRAEHEAFKQKREKHYNEFKVLQALRARQDLDDDDYDNDT